MKAICALLTLAAAATALNHLDDPTWATFKHLHSKTYSSADEEARRYAIFQRNLEAAAQMNRDDAGSATYGITRFSDMEGSEFLQPLAVPQNIQRVSLPVRNSLPTSFSWIEKGAVNAVKNQASCGSCWAFCAVAAMEGAHFVKHSQLVSLAESQLVDCDKTDHGCNGGWPTTGIDYVISAGGIMSEADYPYKPVQQTCKFDKTKVVAKMAKSITFDAKKPEAMQEAMMKYGPLAVAVDAKKYQSYSSGIMTGSGCNQGRPTHGVTAVGWGEENGTKYWIVRNSWGASWGEKGYVRMQRGVNACGVEDYPMGAESA